MLNNLKTTPNIEANNADIKRKALQNLSLF